MTTSSNHRTPATAHHADGGHIHLSLREDLDYSTSQDLLREAAAALADRGPADTLVIDCRSLDFIDSVGLSALLEIHRDAASAAVTMHLAHIGPILEKLLRLTGTYTHLTSAATRENTS
ncbi:anti-anti-sigma factor [Kitasatospora sp. SolWspMP-SS2h]|uniref:STAS domain-containing protein n=1 Tax=Kitasatospora sp. SolWspMP-SS2h TaxID=1305729 RepID=UPI000DB97BC2|nr:STAS domain-containing protein [Kitasatospora sp. SolWspMP-SS2h]RAJ39977.1 anti-anti-sigma factor [Kitasatospora sp. SolWspMP-SS2h]